jgi:rare lipoprotein A
MYFRKFGILIFSALFLVACGSKATVNSKGVYKKGVVASYYHNKYNGKKTASGERFSNSKLTAAHKELKFGTKVKVINPVNNKKVVVVINDRGPHVAGREIDLSKKAFNKITHDKKKGLLTVNLEIVEQPTKKK